MRRKGKSGFTLVETLLATTLLAILVVIATDLLPDVLRSRSLDNLNYQVNQECQRILAQLNEDIRAAGYRFVPPATALDGLFAVNTPAENDLIMNCVTDVGQLAADAAQGAATLSLSGFQSLADAYYLICAYEGVNMCLPVTAIDGSQVTLGSGPTEALPAGTPVAAVRLIEYRVEGTDLVRLVREVGPGGEMVVRERVPIDPAGTAIEYTRDDGGGTTTTLGQLTSTDLDSLLFVNISLRLTRTGSAPGGRTVRTTASSSQRITPLNLKVFGSEGGG